MPALWIPFPSWLKPEIIPGLPFRWYGLMYLAAFAAAYYLYRRQIRERRFPMTEDELSGLFFWCILGLLFGARIFATIVYETSDVYRRQPWLVFWPFRNGRFTGLAGMSYHGGVIGGTLGIIIYSKIKKWNMREIADMYAAAIPAGYTFGRIGNFINGELYGRVTTGPLGMLFPHAAPLPASETWVREAAAQTGIAIGNSGFVNLPRYPSQLFEAFFEGVVCWLLIWIIRKKKPFKGFLAGVYFASYSLCRFFIEYFREPDEELGYVIDFVKNGLSPAASHPALSFSTGQILCALEFLLAIVWLLIAARFPGHEAVYVYPDPAEAAAASKPKKKRRHGKR